MLIMDATVVLHIRVIIFSPCQLVSLCMVLHTPGKIGLRKQSTAKQTDCQLRSQQKWDIRLPDHYECQHWN